MRRSTSFFRNRPAPFPVIPARSPMGSVWGLSVHREFCDQPTVRRRRAWQGVRAEAVAQRTIPLIADAGLSRDCRPMTAMQKRIVIDEHGESPEVIIP